jgi:phosphoribosylpyrophosphate synthetase
MGPRSNETSIMEGDPKNRRVVLVDDVIYSGNTLLNAAKLLKERGASRVSIYATHGVSIKTRTSTSLK